MSKSKVLVTGGAGFIGSHIARWLVKEGMHVVILDDLSGGNKENVPSGAKFIRGSVTDYEFLKQLFNKEEFDYIYHLAAYAAEGLSHFIRRYNYDTNLLGSVNLINLSVNFGVKCFVFTSSIAVYGAGQVPMSEEAVPRPEDPYGISKYAVELDLAAARKQFGLNYIIFRPHNVYGENQNIGDKYRNVVGIFMNSALKKEPLRIFGDGNQTRAFTYIDDVAPIIARSVQVPEAYGEVFNIGGDQKFTVNELASLVSKAMGVKLNTVHLKPRNEVVHAFSSHKKTAEYFGTQLKHTLLQVGIVKMARWVKTVGARKTQDFANIEIPKGLPEGW